MACCDSHDKDDTILSLLENKLKNESLENKVFILNTVKDAIIAELDSIDTDYVFCQTCHKFISKDMMQTKSYKRVITEPDYIDRITGDMLTMKQNQYSIVTHVCPVCNNALTTDLNFEKSLKMIELF